MERNEFIIINDEKINQIDCQLKNIIDNNITQLRKEGHFFNCDIIGKICLYHDKYKQCNF